MTWRLAKSLETLRAEFQARFPDVAHALYGTIGNAEHAARPSRHNPNRAGVVTAMDVPHDPANGLDVHTLVRAVIVPNPPLDLDYVISNRQVASREHGWTWRPYTGADDHTHHAHFGVGRGPDSNPVGPYDDTTPWGVANHQEDWMGDPYNRAEVVGPVDKIAYAMANSVVPTLAFLVAHVGTAAPDVDEKELAKQLAPLLTAQLPHLSDTDFARIAKDVADENARRQAA